MSTLTAVQRIPFVDLQAQYRAIQSDIDTAIANVIGETAFIGGKYVRQFEQDFAEWLETDTFMGCANGTDSIEILLQAYGIGPGDEVIVPAHSWFSTSEAVSTVGAKPIFVDVLPHQYVINPALIEPAITSRTKAIIPVHLYGMPAPMDEIMQLAGQYNLVVIEDCAQSHGALYKGRITGTIGHAASFSFFPGKNLGAYGDAGGMLAKDEKIAQLSRMIAQHGQQGKHNHLIEGRNSRLDGLHAAILSAKLPFLHQWNVARQRIADQYRRFLADAPIELPVVPEHLKHVYHLFVIQTDRRDALMDYLKQAGIETLVHYPTALPLLPAYDQEGYTADQFPIAALQSKRILSLPIYPEMTLAQQEYVADKIGTFFNRG